MPPVHAANLVANGGNTAYGVGVIPTWASLRLKSPVIQLFAQQLVRSHLNRNIKSLIFSALWLSVTGGFLSQRASNGKALWCHHLGTVFKVPMCWNDISHIKSICIQVIQFRSVRIYNGAHTNANVCLFIIYTDMHLYFYSLLFCIEWWKANHQLGIWITRIIKLTKRRHHNSSRVSVTLHLWFTQC